MTLRPHALARSRPDARPPSLPRIAAPLLALALVLCSAPQAGAAPSLDPSKAAMGALTLANHHYKSGNFKKAAALYHDAYRLQPTGAFLFNAARAEMRALDHGAAERDFKRYLNLPETSAKGRKRAQTHLDEIAAYRADLARKQSAAAKRAAAAARPALGGLTVGLWAGAALLVVGGSVSYGAAYAMRRASNDAAINSQDDIDGYLKQTQNQDGVRNFGVVLAGAGVAVGVWAALRTFGKRDAAAAWVAPVVSGRGVGFVGRF